MNPAVELKDYNPASEEGIDDVLLPDQQYIVFQLAHAQTSIRSPDGKAWIRCVGFTKTLDAARELARNAFDMGDKTETRIMPVGRIFLAGRLKYEGLDLPRREEEQLKANRLIDEWIAKREQVHEQTRKIASEKQVVQPSSNAADAEGDQARMLSEQPRPGTPVPHIQVPLLPTVSNLVPEVHRQRSWALGIIPDLTGDDEPALIPLFAANDNDDTQLLVKRAARCKDLIHVDIFVGETGEWLPLDSPLVPQTFHHHPLRQATESKIRWVHS